jgi:hypothetical protein
MKIEHMGFSITEIGERVAGVDVDSIGKMRIAFVTHTGDEKLSLWITPEDAHGLTTALAEALRLNNGGIPE